MANFDKALALVLQEEGGRVDNPRDPGGRTNRGITQRTYDAWRSKQGLAKRDVYEIATAEVTAIYRRDFADHLRFDDLPDGVAYAVFDYGVNSGPSRAAKTLQACVGCQADGVIGSITIAATAKVDAAKLINAMCDARLQFLESLPTWGTFGKGWRSRVAFVRTNALAMASNSASAVTAPPVTPAPPDFAPPHIGVDPDPRPQTWGGWLASLFFRRSV